MIVMDMNNPFNSRMTAKMIQYVNMAYKDEFTELCNIASSPYALINHISYYVFTKKFIKENNTTFNQIIKELLNYAEKLQK